MSFLSGEGGGRGAEPQAPKCLCHPPDPERTRVLVLVSNAVDHDTRVKKTVASLRTAGYAVGILGVAKAGVEHQFSDPGLVRTNLAQTSYNLFFRKQLRGFARLAEDRLVRREKFLAVVTDAKAARNVLAQHDTLLAGLSHRPSLLGKLWLILRQWSRIRKSQALINREAAERKAYARAEAHRLERKAYHLDRLAKKREAYQQYVRPVGTHIDFYKSFIDQISEFRPQIIHANDLLTLPAAIRFKRKYDRRVRVVYDSHELEMHRNKTYNFIRKVADQIVEWRYIRQVDHVITVSDGIADVLARSYGIVRPTVVLNSPSREYDDDEGLKHRLRAGSGLCSHRLYGNSHGRPRAGVAR